VRELKRKFLSHRNLNPLKFRFRLWRDQIGEKFRCDPAVGGPPRPVGTPPDSGVPSGKGDSARAKRVPIWFFILLAGISIFSSCARAPLPPPEISKPPMGTRSDITHTVGPGETCWRISQMYNVPIAAILRANDLTSSSVLKMGQKLLIPQATRPKPIVNLYPSSKWRYIIVHHSATGSGNALSVHNAHIHKGWDRGAGYHFVIDRGASNKRDGQIEMTPRWIKQQDGAHCKASGMNEKGIGVCLIGNFDKQHVTHRQFESLLELVNKLRRYYHIPIKNIIAHGHVEGAATQCPGKKFPWAKFQEELLGAEITKH